MSARALLLVGASGWRHSCADRRRQDTSPSEFPTAHIYTSSSNIRRFNRLHPPSTPRSETSSRGSEVDGARDGRLFHGAVTVYTTEFTTVTVTATSTNTAFTVSVSYGCTLTGMDLPPSC
ncbi:hypothetical protein FJT64_015494 [Amphibalanus amphitrite]|uniref:Uncharacterized protein n=1 Tax=Amphibalanus amphitrite TaxID=1232801 RepID=A0A6A4XGS2_AMPAM|nr:hypothetical protein FJT64_015494 [Amphibalanus amphitrite]